MRRVKAREIGRLVSGLCVEANVRLRPDVKAAVAAAVRREKGAGAKEALRMILKNADIARAEKIPICQDTGVAVVFAEIGQDVIITGGSLKRAIDNGVAEGYRKGRLRKSVVRSPLSRKNTNTNTPAVIHTEITPGDRVRICVMPKGFGSENKSVIRMLNPSDGEKGVADFVVEAAGNAGPEACPPFVLGVGIGGTFDYAAYLAKKALLRKVGSPNRDRRLYSLEKKILKSVNDLKIGPMGLGGNTTALGVSILSRATHIAGLPVAVNVNCHATRSACGAI